MMLITSLLRLRIGGQQDYRFIFAAESDLDYRFASRWEAILRKPICNPDPMRASLRICNPVVPPFASTKRRWNTKALTHYLCKKQNRESFSGIVVTYF